MPLTHRVRRPFDAPALRQRLVATLAAAAIALAALGGTAREARADMDELLRFLAGAVIVAAIVNAVDDSHTPRYAGRWSLPDSCLETLQVNWRHVEVYNARCLDRAGYHSLPGTCYREFRVGHRTRPGYVAECLWDHGYQRSGHGWSEPPRPPAQPPYIAPPIGPGPSLGIAPPPHGRPIPGQPILGRLPDHCAMTYRQDGRRVQGYWARCLRQAGFRDLPQQCRVSATNGDRIFNARCLQEAGYRR